MSNKITHSIFSHFHLLPVGDLIVVGCKNRTVQHISVTMTFAFAYITFNLTLIIRKYLIPTIHFLESTSCCGIIDTLIILSDQCINLISPYAHQHLKFNPYSSLTSFGVLSLFLSLVLRNQTVYLKL